MNTSITTARTRLRAWRLEDAEFLFALHNDPEVMRFIPDEPFESLAATRDSIEAYPDYKQHGFGRMLVEDLETGEPLGWSGL